MKRQPTSDRRSPRHSASWLIAVMACAAAAVFAPGVAAGASSHNHTAVVFAPGSHTKRLVDPRIGDMRDRVPANAASEMDAIGMIETGPADGRLDARGTAFLIDRCHALTNQHVLFGGHGDGVQGARRISFFLGSPERCRNPHRELPGSGLTDSFCHSFIATLDSDGGLDEAAGRKHSVADRERDWAIIRLDASVDRSIRPIPVSDADFMAMARQGVPAVSAGYPGDRLNPANIAKLWGQPDCTILPLHLFADPTMSHEVHMIATTCPATAGNSGSPLLIWNQDHNGLEAIGLIASGPNAKVISALGQKIGRHDFLVPLALAPQHPNIALPLSGGVLAEAIRQAGEEGCP